MRRVVVDAFHFVGLSGGSGGSGNYLLSLIEGLSRLVDVRVVTSRHNAHHFRAVAERARRLTVLIGSDDHAEAIRAAVEDANIIYAPFTVSLKGPHIRGFLQSQRSTTCGTELC